MNLLDAYEQALGDYKGDLKNENTDSPQKSNKPDGAVKVRLIL